ncbi:uncharacterized protein METZ01_LOCUS432102 [marine metagenome]|jgi:hypothetical protein|uniref:Uncharacterized protein n=1 Tax=marine metagenome TaxID=408172 RepID=A0A382Y9S4_9ZZZZ
MIKLFLGAILVLALIGGAIRFASDEHSWQIIIHKQEALHSVQTGAIRIYNIVKKQISGSDISDTSSIVIEEG